ncbi:MAG: peptidase [Bacilli bacterium]|nr:peptidase [Bacilli bacterium]
MFNIRKKLVLTAILVLLSNAMTSIAAAEDKPNSSALVDEIFKIIQQNHVSGVDPQKLSENAIKGMIDGLDDPYTKYMTAKEWIDFQNLLQQNYVGIGVRLSVDDQGVFITEVFKGSPAITAGIQVGDYITAVEGKSMKGVKAEDLINQVLGAENTPVSLTITRNNQMINLTMVRKKISLPVVQGKRFDDGTGYIRLSSFSSDGDELFAAKLKELKQTNIHSLIIDLRDNGGGLLDTAANIAKLFIKDGVMIHTSDRNHVDDPITLHGGDSVSFPVFVLVNENSASASEVLTGALQDYKLATVIGTKSFGKGSVQSIMPLSNGGVLKVTIEEYLTPNKHKVNKVGITPDIEVKGDVPQLITAFHAAGMKDISLTRDHNDLTINQQLFTEDSFSVQTINHKSYVPSRVLTAMIDGKVEWNSDTQTVAVTAGSKSAEFPVSPEGAILIKGTTFLDLDSFSSKFPQLEWKMESDQLTLHVKGN